MSAGLCYFVCDKCGDLAHITRSALQPEDVTFACDKCGSEALWRFMDARKAFEHSMLIVDRVRQS